MMAGTETISASGYVAPMRASVMWLCDLAVPWTVDALANTTGCAAYKALGYCTLLIRGDVLVEEAGLYARGWAYEAWASSRPRTRPGGNARSYRLSAAGRAAGEQRQARLLKDHGRRIRILRQSKNLTAYRLAALAGIHRSVLLRLEQGIKGVSRKTMQRILEQLVQA